MGTPEGVKKISTPTFETQCSDIIIHNGYEWLCAARANPWPTPKSGRPTHAILFLVRDALVEGRESEIREAINVPNV